MNSSGLVSICVVVLLLSSCAKQVLPEKPDDSKEEDTSIETIMPSVEVPRAEKRILLDHKPRTLPKGAKARYPIYAGDAFHVTVPIRQKSELSATNVFDAHVLPALKAMGFNRENTAKSFTLPPEPGVAYQRAKLKGLMDQINDEYQRNPNLLRPKTQEMLDVLSGRRDGDVVASVSKALEMAEDMNLQQYVADIERLEIVYPFQQVVDDVPIEHTLVNASRWEGQSIHSVYGSFFNNFDVVNQSAMNKKQIVARLPDSLLQVDSIAKRVDKKDVDQFRRISVTDGPHLVLLPYGADNIGNTQMHYAYRMIARTHFMGERNFDFLLWSDAADARILKLESLTQQATRARGETFNRAPDVGTVARNFEVDDTSGVTYQLSLSGVMNRVDYLGDGDGANDVSISVHINGSTETFANFNQAPLDDESEALCRSGANKAYQQINFFANIYKYRSWTVANGIFMPFPALPWSPRVESSFPCNANSSMNFGFCDGYEEATCPEYVGEPNDKSRAINYALDNTVVAHEMGHNITQRYTNARPSDWCESDTCPVALGWVSLHDLADFWADHFESTNCNSGWVAKNIDGVDASLNCGATHSEGGGAPRLHEVDIPFDATDPTDPKDHFPEHRDLIVPPAHYYDMQIGTAALWQVRQGMRSKSR
ncbi:MAG: hypothetical protein ACR2P1_26950, partial [Pseudomonadales bacterium]